MCVALFNSKLLCMVCVGLPGSKQCGAGPQRAEEMDGQVSSVCI